MGKVTRRDFIKMGAVGAISAGLSHSLLSSSVNAQPKEVVFLGIFSFTGGAADIGRNMDEGMTFALEEWDYKVLGRPIKWVKRDDESKASIATRRVDEAIETEKAQFILGCSTSTIALPVHEVAKRRKVLQVVSTASEDITGVKCHRYGFQWAAHPHAAQKAVVDTFMKFHPKAKRWYLITADYYGGLALERHIISAAKKYGIEFVGRDLHAVGEKEFSGIVTKIPGAKPDVVCLCNFANDAVQSAKEIYNFGLTPRLPVIMSWSLGVDELRQLKPEMRENLWVGTQYYYTVDTPIAREFAKKYRAKYGRPPGYMTGALYSITRIVLRAIEKAKSTDPKDVIKAMEGWELEDLVGKMKIEAYNHQFTRPNYVLKCKKKTEMKDEWDFAEIVGWGEEPLPREICECKNIGDF